MKFFWVVAALALVLPSGALAQEEKYTQMPPIFAVTVEEESLPGEGNQSVVYKEYLITTHPKVNATLRQVVDGYVQAWAPTLEADPKGKGEENSRLDVDTLFYRTGDRYLSTMTLARTVYYREQRSLVFSTHTFDLETGEELQLSHLFEEKSPAWDILAQGVRQQLSALYPGEAIGRQALEELCSIEALRQTPFTLSGMELTLHYDAGALFEGKTHLAQARFYYPSLWDLMTDAGRAATDNSRWKMVAITCDDGPRDFRSTYALNAFRKVGARVTFFVVGEQLEKYGDVFQRQMDQNHSFGSHTYHHWSGYSIKKRARRILELDRSDEVTLRLVGRKAPFLRAPGGTYPPWVEGNMPVPIIQWSVDTYDYTGKKPERILASFQEQVTEHDIILCHDTGRYLYQAVPLVGEYLTENGFMMVTLEELLAAQGVEAKANVVYFSFRPGENSEERKGTKVK